MLESDEESDEYSDDEDYWGVLRDGKNGRFRCQCASFSRCYNHRAQKGVEQFAQGIDNSISFYIGIFVYLCVSIFRLMMSN